MGFALYDHQLEVIDKLKSGSILCGGVGSGKSITALYYFFSKVCGGYIWGTDFKPMTQPIDLYIITTAKKRDDKEWELEAAPFLIFKDPDLNPSGTKLVVDSWNNIYKYKDVTNAFFIFDEQRVVGSGQWVKSFIKISKSNQWLLLTATPGDTWTDYIPVFIANGFYKNRTEFERRHCVFNPFLRYKKVDRYVETARLVRLRNMILVRMDFKRQTTSHHLDVTVDYDKELTDILMKDRWNFYEEEPIKDAGQLCYLLRRVCNEDISRIEKVTELIEQVDKVIIFYSFDYELTILKIIADKVGYPFAEWNGHRHQEIPKEKKWIYAVNYSAGAEGWNCIETNSMIFYSQCYSYKMMVQAAGRIDRLNTPFSDLYFYHIKSNAPIDKAIERSLEMKENFNEKAFISF